ncbi:MAG: hypothetical protein O9292_15960, partial [Rhodobacteraceae bacterium]|nr:hypothetical protein [Paracoccaceae bacterium]
LVSYGETQPVIQTPGPEEQNRRTVTEVSGFMQRHPTVLDGNYAAIIYRTYIEGAVSAPTTTVGAEGSGDAGGSASGGGGSGGGG